MGKKKLFFKNRGADLGLIIYFNTISTSSGFKFDVYSYLVNVNFSYIINGVESEIKTSASNVIAADLSSNLGIATIKIYNAEDVYRIGMRQDLFTDIDIYNAVNLKVITGWDDQPLEFIDFSNNNLLEEIYFEHMALTSLILKDKLYFHSLYTSGSSELTVIDLENLPSLTHINMVDIRNYNGSFQFNGLTALTNLTLNRGGNTGILDLSTYPTLKSVSFSYCDWQTVNFGGCPNLASITVNIYGNLNVLDVTNVPSLKYLSTNGWSGKTSNKFTSVDLSQNPLLYYFSAYPNKYTTFSIANNPLITYLNLRPSSTEPQYIPSTDIDNVLIDLDNYGLSNGTCLIPNNRTALSDTAKANLQAKGWAVSEYTQINP